MTTNTAEAKKAQVVQDRDRIIRLESDVDGLKTGVEKLGRYVEHMDQKLEEYFERLFKSKDAEARERLRETQDKGKVWFSAAFGVFGVITTIASLNYWAMLATVRPIEVEMAHEIKQLELVRDGLTENIQQNIDHRERVTKTQAIHGTEIIHLQREIDRLRDNKETP